MREARMDFGAPQPTHEMRIVGKCSRCQGSLVEKLGASGQVETNFLDYTNPVTRQHALSRQYHPQRGDTQVCYECLGIKTGPQDEREGNQGLSADPGFLVQKL